LPALDVWALRRAGRLDAAQGATSLRLGTIEHRLIVKADAIELWCYAGRSLLDRLLLEWQPSTFGGSRPFLVCPRCKCRRVRLYLHGSIACRVCLRAVYRSQSVSDTPNSHAQRERLLSLLARPSGSRRSTISARLRSVEREIEAALADEQREWDQCVLRIREADAGAAR
jgi:hypothetical protein